MLFFRSFLPPALKKINFQPGGKKQVFVSIYQYMDVIDKKEIITGEGLLKLLRTVDWPVLLPKLHYYSLNKLQRFPALAERFNVNALATQLADEAVKQLWTEERTWDLTKYPDVIKFLKSAVDSLRSNFLRSKGVSATVFLSEEHEDTIAGQGADPESIMIAREIKEQLMDLFTDEPFGFQVFECIVNRIPPREMSIEIDVPVTEVYNIIKRVKRKIALFRQSNE
jgi:hypothetical protein